MYPVKRFITFPFRPRFTSKLYTKLCLWFRFITVKNLCGGISSRGNYVRVGICDALSIYVVSNIIPMEARDVLGSAVGVVYPTVTAGRLYGRIKRSTAASGLARIGSIGSTYSLTVSALIRARVLPIFTVLIVFYSFLEII